MKKTTTIVAFTALLATFTFTACNNTREEKMEDAKENIEEAREDVSEAATMDNSKADNGTVTVEEWNSYRADVDARIQANNARIAELKEKMKKSGRVLDNARQKRIDELEARNAKLKQQLADYKRESGGWAAFKAEVDREMDEVSKSLDEFVADAKN